MKKPKRKTYAQIARELKLLKNHNKNLQIFAARCKEQAHQMALSEAEMRNKFSDALSEAAKATTLQKDNDRLRARLVERSISGNPAPLVGLSWQPASKYLQ